MSFGGVQALSDVTFTAGEGEITGVIGPNGAGKTTLFNCLSGINRTKSGTIMFAGSAIDRLPPHQRARLGLRRTFQNVALFEGLSVLDNIRTGADHAATRVGGPVSSKVIAEELIATTGLREFTNAPVSTLSTGYRKGVEIARAVAGNSRILLLDEPTAGILPRDAVSIMELVQGLRRGRGLTVLIVEHQRPMVMSLCDHVVALDFGRVIAEGAPVAIQRNKAVQNAYLGAPDE